MKKLLNISKEKKLLSTSKEYKDLYKLSRYVLWKRLNHLTSFNPIALQELQNGICKKFGIGKEMGVFDTILLIRYIIFRKDVLHILKKKKRTRKGLRRL